MARSLLNLTTEVQGILPVANGGTGSATATGTGFGVRATNPTLTNPVASGNAFLLQPAVTALTATGTLTIAQMLTGIITMTESYIPTVEYNMAVIAFAAALGLDTDLLKMPVREEFDVWPESIRADAVCASNAS